MQIEIIRECAIEAVAFCIHGNQNYAIINGDVVMRIASYLQTCHKLTQAERTAALGYAVDMLIQ